MDKNGKNTNQKVKMHKIMFAAGVAGVAGLNICLLYTSDAADD